MLRVLLAIACSLTTAACFFTLAELRSDASVAVEGGADPPSDVVLPVDEGERAEDAPADAPADARDASSTVFRRADFEQGSLLRSQGGDRAGVGITLVQPGLTGAFAARIMTSQGASLAFDLDGTRSEVTLGLRLEVVSNAGKRPRIALFRAGGKTTASLVLDAGGRLELDYGVFGDPGFEVGTSPMPLTHGTVYRVELRYAAGTGAATVEGRIAESGATPVRFAFASDRDGANPTAVELGATTTVGADIILDDIELRAGR